MYLYFRDQVGKLRIVDAGEAVTIGDLNNQRELRNFIERGLTVRVKSPILTLLVNDHYQEEPRLA